MGDQIDMNGRVVRLDPAAHKVADALLPWFVNATLDADERALVERHLGECARCRDEVEWLRDLHAACVAGEASPGASSAFHKLRTRLDAPRARVAQRSRPPWRLARPWTHWVIGAQLVLIAGFGALWLQDSDHAARYRTLGAPGAASQPAGSLVVVFNPSASEAELRRVLRSVGARVVDGPTQANAYVLDVPVAGRERALKTLRTEPAVALVEELAPGRAQ